MQLEYTPNIWQSQSYRETNSSTGSNAQDMDTGNIIQRATISLRRFQNRIDPHGRRHALRHLHKSLFEVLGQKHRSYHPEKSHDFYISQNEKHQMRISNYHIIHIGKHQQHNVSCYYFEHISIATQLASMLIKKDLFR